MKSILFSGSPWDTRPRILWQELFNAYREFECDLSNLDNLLIDFENCKNLFDELNGDTERAVFLWGCYKGSFPTTWIPDKKWLDSGLSFGEFLHFQTYDHYLLCTVTSEQASFERYHLNKE